MMMQIRLILEKHPLNHHFPEWTPYGGFYHTGLIVPVIYITYLSTPYVREANAPLVKQKRVILTGKIHDFTCARVLKVPLPSAPFAVGRKSLYSHTYKSRMAKSTIRGSIRSCTNAIFARYTPSVAARP